MEITELQPERDVLIVRSWLSAHVRDHLRAWSKAVGTPWDDEQIAVHMDAHGLVDREWRDLDHAAQHAPRGCVRAARVGGRAVGVLWAEERVDRFLCRPVAALCWVYVARAWRGRGAAQALMGAYDAWAATRPVAAREVYVTAGNAAAQRLYEAHGLTVSDHRMFAPGPGAATAAVDGPARATSAAAAAPARSAADDLLPPTERM